MSEKVKVTINGVSGEVETGKTLLEASSEIGAGLTHLCLGNGLCNSCRVEVLEGAESLSEKAMKERVSLNYHLSFAEECRLACQSQLKGTQAITVESFNPYNPRSMIKVIKRLFGKSA